MTELTLTIIDTIGIQDYIFASNRLRENLGASALVERAIGEWVREALPPNNNLDAEGNISDDRRIEADDSLEAELLLQGGGNALIIFRSKEAARQMVSELSEKLLTHAPGLSVAVAHEPCDWERPLGGKGGALDRLYRALARAKQIRPSDAPMLGQGVTLECRSTGLPAVDIARPQGDDDDLDRPASADVIARIEPELLASARQRFADLLPADVVDHYALPDRFDDLGRTEGVQSYIAVVHADGNGIGRRFTQLNLVEQDNREHIRALRRLSAKVDEAGRLALKRTIATLARAFTSPDRRDPDDPIKLLLNSLPRDRASGNHFFPFRPIVFGGDDVTFVCDGRLGLALAAEYLRQFHTATSEVALPDGPAHACAGAAIVKTHFPFARAYALAEELCDQAKGELRDAGRDDSAIDWHFAISGLLADLETLRLREYTPPDGGHLLARPLTVFGPGLGPAWRTLPAFEQLVTTLQRDDDWRERRNKVKELREVLRQGARAVTTFRHAFRLPNLPSLGGAATLAETGWDGDRCGYFDAIEALDFYISLT